MEQCGVDGQPVAEGLLGADFERVDLFLVGPGREAQDCENADVETAGLVALAVRTINQGRVIRRVVDFYGPSERIPARVIGALSQTGHGIVRCETSDAP